MGSITLTHGTMGAGKTTLALQLYWQLNQHPTRRAAALWTFGDRSGDGTVTSRIGLNAHGTPVTPGDDLTSLNDALRATGTPVLIIDEIQFATINQIDQLAELADTHTIDIHTFGLSGDFQLNIFPAIARLIVLADTVNQLPINAYCWCGQPARCNARLHNGHIVRHGPQTLIGDTTGTTPADYTYTVLCRTHYRTGQPTDPATTTPT